MADQTTDVFISYKRRMRPQVAHIAEALRALKLTVWYDARLEPGVSFTAEIAQEVRGARAVLVCWTNDCFPHGGDQNGWVLGEAAIGRGRGAYVPVLLEPADLDPPYNNDHVESLIGWARADGLGRQDDQAWLDVLSVIGKKVGRPGLEAFSKAQANNDVEGLRRFAQDHPADPLADEVWAQIAEAEAAAARQRTQDARRAALDAAANRPAAPEAPKPAFAAPPKPVEPPEVSVPTKRPAPWLVYTAIAALFALGAGVWFVTSARGPASPQPEAAVLNGPPAAVEAPSMPSDQSSAPTANVPAAPPPAQQTPAGAASTEEAEREEAERLAFSQVDRRNADALRAHLRTYPSGYTTREATILLNRLGSEALVRARRGGLSGLEQWASNWSAHPSYQSVLGEIEALRNPPPKEASNPSPTASKSNAACPALEFKIYFDWDRADISPTASQTIDAALARARGCQLQRITIIGHADTSQSTAYSQALSERMAAAVRHALVSRGVNANLIETSGRGETGPARPTADGVREPLNRRVEVAFTFR